jgi:hypothetical protein
METVIKYYLKLCLYHFRHAVRKADIYLREVEYLRIASKTPE